MSAQDVQTTGGKRILSDLLDATSIRLAIGGVVLTILALIFDQTGVIGHTIPPLLFIWGIASTVIGFSAYGIIWLNAPK
jgi:hypothetical protein